MRQPFITTLLKLADIPMHVIFTLKEMKLPPWTEFKYSTAKNEFVGHAYDLVRQMIETGTKHNVALNGNGVIKPRPSRMAQIIRDDVNNTDGREKESSSWIHPYTQVDINELMIKSKGILTWLNELDPCNDNFLLPELEIVKMNSVNNTEEVVEFATQENMYDGPDGVLSILDFDSIVRWGQEFNKHFNTMAKEKHNKTRYQLKGTEAKRMQTLQESYKVDLKPQDILDMSFGKVRKDQNTYTFTKVKKYSSYIMIPMSTATEVLHFRDVYTEDLEYTKEEQETKHYKKGETRLFSEHRPVRYGIKTKDITTTAYIYDRPQNKQEADKRTRNERTTRKKIRPYKIYGIIVKPITQADTGSGHFECFVRTRHKQQQEEFWRHFDDDRDIQEYDLKNLPQLNDYTIVAVFMKDVSN